MAEIQRVTKKPMSYIGMHAVMKHLSFEKRFDLIKQAPATRAAHRSAPLKLNHLELNKSKIRINNATFTVGVITHYPDSPTPKWAKTSNSSGGSQQDIVKEAIDPAPSDFETETNYEREAKLQGILTNIGSDTPSVAEKLEIQGLRQQIQGYYEKLAISQLKKVHYIQFTMTSLARNTYKNQKIERVCYGVPLENAKVYFMENLMGVSNKQVFVKHFLKINSTILSWPGSHQVNFDGNQLRLQDGMIASASILGQEFVQLLAAKFEGEYYKSPIGIQSKIHEAEMDETIRKALELMPAMRENREKMGSIERKEYPLVLKSQVANNINLTVELKKTAAEQIYTFNIKGQKIGVVDLPGPVEENNLEAFHVDLRALIDQPHQNNGPRARQLRVRMAPPRLARWEPRGRADERQE